MKKFFIPTFIFILLYKTLLSADYTMLNLFSPTNLEKHNLNFSIRHRFYGDITDDPFGTFFGMDAGANTHVAVRYQMFQNIELKTSYTRKNQEKTLGLSYKYEKENLPLNAQFDLEYFIFNQTGLEKEKKSNSFGLISLQSKPYRKIIAGTFNAGYDGYYERFVLGLGITFNLLEDFGLFELMSLIAEYYPVLDRKDTNHRLRQYIGSDNAMAFGIKLDTYGHRFILMVSNSDDFHLRHTAFGVTDNSYWRFGFNIERILGK